MADVIRELAISIGFDVDMSGMDEANSALDKFESTAESGGDSVEGFGEQAEGASVKTVALGNILANAATKLASMGLAAGKAAIKFGVDLVKGFAETGDRIAKTSKQLGIGAEDLQRLEFAAQRSGASTATLTKGLRTMTVGLLDASEKGTGPMQEGLDALGLSVKDLEGKGAEERMGILAEALKGVGDESKKAAIAAKLFGTRSGTELKPLLDEGARGIRELGDTAEKLGGVLDEKALKAAEDLTDAMLDMDTVVEGAKNKIGAALVPALLDASDGMLEFLGENEAFIEQDLPAMMDSIAKATEGALKWIVEFIDDAQALNVEMGRLDENTDAVSKDLVKFRDEINGVVDSVKDAVKWLGILSDEEDKIVNKRGLTGVAQVQESKGPGGGTAQDTADVAAATVVTPDRSAADLERIANDSRVPESVRKNAKTFLRTARAREKNEADDAAQAKADARKSEDDAAGRGRGRRRSGGRGRRGKGKKKKKKKEVSLIDAIIGGSGFESEGGGSRVGGGASATSGPQFAGSIDRSFRPQTTINFVLPATALAGMSTGEQSNAIVESARDLFDSRMRGLFEHYQGTFNT